MKTGVFSFLVLSLLAGDALALARHDRPQVSAMKKNGKTIGFNLTLTIHPDSYQHVRVGLGRMKVPASLSSVKRELAAGTRAGYLRVKLGRRDNLTNSPVELKFKVLYGKGGLKPGQKVDVVSAFYNSESYFHVYGMFDGPVNQGDTSSVITLPK